MIASFRLFLFMLLLGFPLFPSGSYASVSADVDILRHFFDDVLLIVNFNHPHYDNKHFLAEIYGPYFSHMVFYGERAAQGIYTVKHDSGYYVQKAIRDAMKRWPNYKGYICCQDDCFMNFWNLIRLDKSKIWFHQYWTASLHTPDHWWPWWSQPWGYDSAIQAYKKLPRDSVKMLERNCGSFACAFSWADFIYIPAKHRDNFIRTSKKFLNPNVFLEIALPSIVLSLDSFENMEKLNTCWAGTVKSIDFEQYDIHYDWIHPIKFSQSENRDFIRHIMNNRQ